MVVKEAEMAKRTEERSEERAGVRTEVEIEATPEEVWEALVTEQGRERWLDEPARDVHIEVVESPHRLVWWWVGEDEPATRVEFLVVAAPSGTRVVVTESAPAFPLATLAASFAGVCA
jgi:uncharacterized protein YndB with AHSA1/START domain